MGHILLTIYGCRNGSAVYVSKLDPIDEVIQQVHLKWIILETETTFWLGLLQFKWSNNK